MKYLLDTNICIYIAKEHPPHLLKHFQSLSVGSTGMSAVTYGELQYGLQKSRLKKNNSKIFEKLADYIPVLPLTKSCGYWHGKIRSELEKQGKVIGNNDLWIAAHALSEKLILITNNTREFFRIPSLRVENWAQ